MNSVSERANNSLSDQEAHQLHTLHMCESKKKKNSGIFMTWLNVLTNPKVFQLNWTRT